MLYCATVLYNATLSYLGPFGPALAQRDAAARRGQRGEREQRGERQPPPWRRRGWHGESRGRGGA